LHPSPSIEALPYLSSHDIACDVLRLDQIHPVISGNKWYKLRYYLDEATHVKAKTIASFGGPYSNHLVALAFASKLAGLKSIGYVRRNDGEPITTSLHEAITYGMEIINLGRTTFQEKKNELISLNANNINETYFVDEGGYGILGARGASTIISDWEHSNINSDGINPMHAYDNIVCAVGTGTMIAGIINAAATHQQILGIPVLKNEGSIKDEINILVNNKNANFELKYDFHQGGYAKTTTEQINFMNKLWEHAQLPTDIVYTGKLFYAMEQLLQQKYFKQGSKVLVVHSGGLQGNRSLEKGVLHF
jgi:1-aminocyclopropane-1-carboxylate deaminase